MNYHYFQPRPAFSDDAADYVLHFINITRPDLAKYPQIGKLGDWMRYGENDYRIWSHISKTDLSAVISQTLQLTPEQFTIIDSDDYTGYSYF
ncbi:hypothetical protein [Loigolactobacillus binensis]|uniref:Uncharacterized protein n=1 Tax=Loigolactobacillus binensis TaxID=2559922 RepID=A0ABW3E9J9_9LACO|nr:hypothetical protein [Loigolactobacillus binensis]